MTLRGRERGGQEEDHSPAPHRAPWSAALRTSSGTRETIFATTMSTTATASEANVSTSEMGSKNASYHGSSSGLFKTQCSPMPQPALGFQRIIQGNGTTVGTVISLQCPDKHRLIGNNIKCVMDVNSTHWEGETYCKPLSYNEGYGFQLAVLLSLVSTAIIFLMSMAFLTCCLVDCIENSKRKKLNRDSTDPLQWVEQHHYQQEMDRQWFSNKSRNNNNNNFMEREVTPWNQRDPVQCDSSNICRCLQQYGYDPTGSSRSFAPASRLPPLLPGHEYNQPLLPQNPTSSQSCSQPQYSKSSGQTLDSALIHVPTAGPSSDWGYGAQQSSLPGATKHSSRKNNSPKEFSIRIISV